jgi:hypothetical protein
LREPHVEDDEVHHAKTFDVKVFPMVERGGRGRPMKHRRPPAHPKGTRSREPTTQQHQLSLGKASCMQNNIPARPAEADDMDATPKSDRGARRSVPAQPARAVSAVHGGRNVQPTTPSNRGHGHPRKSLTKATLSEQEIQDCGRRGRGRPSKG